MRASRPPNAPPDRHRYANQGRGSLEIHRVDVSCARRPEQYLDGYLKYIRTCKDDEVRARNVGHNHQLTRAGYRHDRNKRGSGDMQLRHAIDDHAESHRESDRGDGQDKVESGQLRRPLVGEEEGESYRVQKHLCGGKGDRNADEAPNEAHPLARQPEPVLERHRPSEGSKIEHAMRSHQPDAPSAAPASCTKSPTTRSARYRS